MQCVKTTTDCRGDDARDNNEIWVKWGILFGDRYRNISFVYVYNALNGDDALTVTLVKLQQCKDNVVYPCQYRGCLASI